MPNSGNYHEKFGKCFNRKCGEVSIIEKDAREIGSDACEKTFSNHIFFMALENSICFSSGRDYVTEKLYRSLKLGIIPITLGAVNYSEFAPPHSFIDAKKFQTEADLAIYLTKVANNVSLYNELLLKFILYFVWCAFVLLQISNLQPYFKVHDKLIFFFLDHFILISNI
ncbi:Alpha-(1,3)-fucosyltransferase C [Armadillidium vulgare]|nr:Alpha-(1,3)-fucosyltransferase C [Armadillidium vulgare]